MALSGHLYRTFLVSCFFSVTKTEWETQRGASTVFMTKLGDGLSAQPISRRCCTLTAVQLREYKYRVVASYATDRN